MQIDVSVLTIAWSMCASASLMLALMHALLWLSDRSTNVYLLSTLMALGATVNAVSEMLMMFSSDIRTYALMLKLNNLGIFVTVVSLVWFVHFYLQTGWRWMVVAITVMWSVSIVINFVLPFSIVFSELSELVPVTTYWGETFSIARGVNSAWVSIPNAASFLILAFLTYSSVQAWRTGNRRRAAVVAGGPFVFILLGGIQAPLVDAGILLTPYLVSFFFLAIVAALSYELVSDALLASRYAREISVSERRWESLLDTVPVFVAGLDRDGRIEYANPLLRKVSGYTTEELSQSHFTDLLHEGERGRGRRIFEEALQGRGTSQVRMSLLTKDQSTRDVVWSTGLVTDDDERAVGMLSIGTDVTERVRAQEELQQTRREMELLTRTTLLGEVAAGLAHELNQPLTAILSNAQAARRMLASGKASLVEVNDIIEDIIADDKRAGSVIQGLRSLMSRSDGVRESVDINEIIQDVAGLLGGEFQAQHITLSLELEPIVRPVLADPVQIQQVAMNLLSNAMQAMKDVPWDQRKLAVRCWEQGEFVTVSVSDSGKGIEPELLATLFDLFVTTRSEGLGIGLVICRRIVEVHGGQISAENGSDGGANFRFTLPLGKVEMAAAR